MGDRAQSWRGRASWGWAVAVLRLHTCKGLFLFFLINSPRHYYSLYHYFLDLYIKSIKYRYDLSDELLPLG